MRLDKHGFKSPPSINRARDRDVTRREQVRQEGGLGLVTPIAQTDSLSYSGAISPSPLGSGGSVLGDVLGRRQPRPADDMNKIPNKPSRTDSEQSSLTGDTLTPSRLSDPSPRRSLLESRSLSRIKKGGRKGGVWR